MNYKKIRDNDNAIMIDGKVVMSFDPRYKEYLKWKNDNPELERQLVEELDLKIGIDKRYNNGAPHKEDSPLQKLFSHSVQVWTWYDKGGNLILKSEMQREVNHGKQYAYFTNGNLKSEIEYIEGKKNGKFIEWNSEKVKIMEGEYKNEKRVGEWLFNYDSGKPKWIGQYKNDVIVEELIQYEESGNILSVENFKDGKLNGPFEYFQNGKLREVGHMVDNKKNGEVKAYWVNQNLKRIENFKMGIAEGEFKEFFIGGTLMSSGKTKLGLPRGTWQWYYENEKLKREMVYTDGVRTKSSEWDKKGNMLYEQEWKGNIQHGSCKYWNIHGLLVKNYNYRNGKLHGKFTDYYQTGVNRSSGNMKYDMMQGDWTFWFHNGKKEVSCTFNLGTPTGTAKIWHDNGTLKKVINEEWSQWDSHKL
jgi:antitoxin component YwqK of YwqJK toxin-antitoxin module